MIKIHINCSHLIQKVIDPALGIIKIRFRTEKDDHNFDKSFCGLLSHKSFEVLWLKKPQKIFLFLREVKLFTDVLLIFYCCSIDVHIIFHINITKRAFVPFIEDISIFINFLKFLKFYQKLKQIDFYQNSSEFMNFVNFLKNSKFFIF